MSRTTKEIFLSYGREQEVIYFVKKLKQDLESNGFSIWLDTEDISSGCDWHGALGTALDNCKAIMPVITQKYISSHFCKGELYMADSNMKLIFPLFFEDADLSANELTRGVKFIISGINWTMFRPGIEDYNVSLGKLIQGLKEQGLGQESDTTETGDLPNQMAKMHLSAMLQPSAPSPDAACTSSYSPHHSPYGGCYPPPHQPYYSPTPSPPNPAYQPQNHGYPPYNPAYPPPIICSPPNPGFLPLNQIHFPPSPAYPIPGNIPYPHSPAYGVPPSTAYQQPPMMGNVYQSPTTGTPTYHQQQYQPLPQLPQQVHIDPPPPYEIVSAEPIKVCAAAETEKGGEFKVGMKLEVVDKRFPHFVCVATIMDRNDDDGRVLIHFDGWGPGYNYWCSHDDVELHPSGWCEKHNWELQRPRELPWENWSTYLKDTHSERAPDELFNEDQMAGPGSLLFEVEMKIEARDRKKLSRICVATITDVRPREVKVHLDGRDHNCDYWCDSSSTDIHPPMWSGKVLKKAVEKPSGFVGTFKWSDFLADSDNRPAPAHLFTEAQGYKIITSTNEFQKTMRLEAKDRLNPDVVAVATIENIKDGKLLIRLDGWGSRHDYWCVVDCIDIHPAGWCHKNQRHLQPPKGHLSEGMFDWNAYLTSAGGIIAPEHLFTPDQKIVLPSVSTKFRPGMKLEAKDRQNPSMICVATVSDVNSNGKLLIHFDGWGDNYNYWCWPDTADIHPIGWCEKNQRPLHAPLNYAGASPFRWSNYLANGNFSAAPEELFVLGNKSHILSGPSKFRPGMKLEAKDRQNPSMICVATVSDVNSNGKLLIHFDGWGDNYDYWCSPDTADIHPIGWCEKNQRPLHAPHRFTGTFNWSKYLCDNGFVAATDNLFSLEPKCKDELTDYSMTPYEPLQRPGKKRAVSTYERDEKNCASGNSTRKKTDGRGGRVDGALLCLPLPNAERLKHLSVPKAARKLAVCMHEPKYNLIKNAIYEVGLDTTVQLFHEASQIQEEGGITSGEGNFKRAPGGVFFYLLKKFASPMQVKIIFQMDNKKKKRLNAQKLKQSKKNEMDAMKLDGNNGCGVFSRLGPLPKMVAADEVELKQEEERKVEFGSEEGDEKGAGKVREQWEECEGMNREDEMMDVDSVETSELIAAQMFDRTDSPDFSHLLTLD